MPEEKTYSFQDGAYVRYNGKEYVYVHVEKDGTHLLRPCGSNDETEDINLEDIDDTLVSVIPARFIL